VEDEGNIGSAGSTSLHGSSAAAPASTAHLNSLYTAALEDILVQRLQWYGSYPGLKKLALGYTAELVVLEAPTVIKKI
jgi:hypothetical protein